MYRKHLVYLKGLISLFEFEWNVFGGQSLQRKYRGEVYGPISSACICWHFDIPAAWRLVAGFNDEPLHISAGLNINDPHHLLKLANKGHIAPSKNKLYTVAQDGSGFSHQWVPSSSSVLSGQRQRKKSGTINPAAIDIELQRACKDNFTDWLLKRESWGYRVIYSSFPQRLQPALQMWPFKIAC